MLNSVSSLNLGLSGVHKRVSHRSRGLSVRYLGSTLLKYLQQCTEVDFYKMPFWYQLPHHHLLPVKLRNKECLWVI